MLTKRQFLLSIAAVMLAVCTLLAVIINARAELSNPALCRLQGDRRVLPCISRLRARLARIR